MPIRSKPHRFSRLAWPALSLILLLTACGGGGEKSVSIRWETPGVPLVSVTPSDGMISFSTVAPTVAIAPTNPPAPPTAVPTELPTAEPAVAEAAGDASLADLGVNELGFIPILEYHAFTTDPAESAPFVRFIGDFEADLQWLYDHNFYVVPLRDIILNNISAPAGTHPVALTFDDSTAGQFRYLAQADGTLAIDSTSAVAIMEDFFNRHPDFGRGGFFAALAPENVCFSWTEEDQNPYCEQKIVWLLDHGYEIGNHTLNHLRVDELDTGSLIAELAEPFLWFKRYDERANPDIFSVPFGAYPATDEQKAMLLDGFSYDGQSYAFLGCLMVGAEPAKSPVSTDWDPLWIPRIQAADTDEWGVTAYWFPLFEGDPGMLYVSDGDPDTITVPNDLPEVFAGTLNETRIANEGKTLLRY